jgi:hypothetical protein
MIELTPPVHRLLSFIKERHAVYLRRQAGLPKPWTTDPILRQWKFCNVYRELDRVTIWIRQNWREPNQDDPDLWFAMTVARLVNWPDTLAEIGYPVPWDPERFMRIMKDRKKRGLKVYTGAYMITAGADGVDKATHQANNVFGPMWAKRETMRPRPKDDLNMFHMLLGQFNGLGSFMAAQVVADLKYVRPLEDAKDWWSFAASGPGSRRGLNRVRGRGVNEAWTEDEWRLELRRLQGELDPFVERASMPRLHGQDLQNCLCEFDKMERVRLGEGFPRSKYDGG